MILTVQEIAGRARAKRTRRVNWLWARIDRYVAAGETFKPGSKMRVHWLAQAEKARAELRDLERDGLTTKSTKDFNGGKLQTQEQG